MEQEHQTQRSGWKNYFMTVTPFSKTLAMLVFILLPFVGFWLGVKYGTGMTLSKFIPTQISTDGTIEEEDVTRVQDDGAAGVVTWFDQTNLWGGAIAPRGVLMCVPLEPSTIDITETASWKLFSDEQLGFSLKYPQLLEPNYSQRGTSSYPYSDKEPREYTFLEIGSNPNRDKKGVPIEGKPILWDIDDAWSLEVAVPVVGATVADISDPCALTGHVYDACVGRQISLPNTKQAWVVSVQYDGILSTQERIYIIEREDNSVFQFSTGVAAISGKEDFCTFAKTTYEIDKIVRTLKFQSN